MFRKYQGGRQDVNVCVCSGGTSSDLTTIKEVVFRTFDCCLQHPPPKKKSCDGGGLLEGPEQHNFDVQHGASKRLLVEEKLG